MFYRYFQKIKRTTNKVDYNIILKKSKSKIFIKYLKKQKETKGKGKTKKRKCV